MTSINPYETHTRRVKHHLVRLTAAAALVDVEAADMANAHYAANPRPVPVPSPEEVTDSANPV